MRKFKLSNAFHWYYIFVFFVIFGLVIYLYRSFSFREGLDLKDELKDENIFNNITDGEFDKLKSDDTDFGDYTIRDRTRETWIEPLNRSRKNYISLQDKNSESRSAAENKFFDYFEEIAGKIIQKLKDIRTSTTGDTNANLTTGGH